MSNRKYAIRSGLGFLAGRKKWTCAVRLTFASKRAANKFRRANTDAPARAVLIQRAPGNLNTRRKDIE